MNSTFKKLLGNERGDFGVKQIAITVAIIVVIGFVIATVQTLMPTWIQEIWEMFIDQIQGLIS